MNAITGPARKLALPRICRTYQCGSVSPFQGIGGEFLGSVVEVAAANHLVGQQVSQQVGDGVSE
jgi:hypothetical protein